MGHSHGIGLEPIFLNTVHFYMAVRIRWWLFGLLLCAQGAVAQVRVVGSWPLRVLQPDASASLKEAIAYNINIIEGTVEAALRAGRLQSNLAAWQQLSKADWERGWSLSFSKQDTTALHSLRTLGYFRGAFGRKSYVLYLEQASAFYVVTVFNCGWGGGELGVESIRPVQSSGGPPVLSKSETKHYLALLFDELVCQNALALSPKGPVYWRARLNLQNVSLKKCQ
ncbi:hypothetical protein [Hymenobacter armeniacus]|uniref:DUF4468 domain-containing protein n=1 Tax=Hymenobacter armeniacus TaxID=2771358 RepID=A0ABR8JTN1_9BACT|nr:hypothetical protein [Hymenobacter armeniacus]MBD2722308.1 hypothetical protein [Hymenobacter armeniacus]